MKLRHKEALGVLGLNSLATRETIKDAYRRACSKYHPDRNPGGLEMMKLVNAAYEVLQDYEAPLEDFVNDEAAADDDDGNMDLGDVLNGALSAVVDLGLTIEVCGCWVWVSGDTKPHKDVLKAAGYMWAPVKKMWSFCGGKRTSSRGKWDMDKIRGVHGSRTVKPSSYTRLDA